MSSNKEIPTVVWGNKTLHSESNSFNLLFKNWYRCIESISDEQERFYPVVTQEDGITVYDYSKMDNLPTVSDTFAALDISISRYPELDPDAVVKCITVSLKDDNLDISIEQCVPVEEISINTVIDNGNG